MNEIKHLPKWDQQNIKKLLREANEKGYQRALRDVDYLKPRLAISKARESLKNISHMVADTYNNLGEWDVYLYTNKRTKENFKPV